SVRSLQAKQRALLQQLDSLDQEREELQASLGEAEEDKAQLAEQLQQSQDQSGKQLQAQQELLDTLQQEKLALEQSILELQANTSRLEEQAQDLRERERLLVFFPDLHVPAEMQFESSANLTEDMESQLQANKIRIQVLERENAQLEALLAKVKAAAEQGVLKVSWVPQGWVLCTAKPPCGPQTSSGDPGRQPALQAAPGRAHVPGQTLPNAPSAMPGAWPPLTPHQGSPQINTDQSEFPNREIVFHQQPPRGPRYWFFVRQEGKFPRETWALPCSLGSCSRDVPGLYSSVTHGYAAAGVPTRAVGLMPGHSMC
uniref:Uncharacterized protein n=1 Tax=Catharus ustulatus TaxID=91951 RepID=A0A8C3UUZ3_CATUS